MTSIVVVVVVHDASDQIVEKTYFLWIVVEQVAMAPKTCSDELRTMELALSSLLWSSNIISAFLRLSPSSPYLSIYHNAAHSNLHLLCHL